MSAPWRSFKVTVITPDGLMFLVVHAPDQPKAVVIVEYLMRRYDEARCADE
jgi:hypothetical protein